MHEFSIPLAARTAPRDRNPHNPLGEVRIAATIHIYFAVNNFAWIEVNPDVNESAPDLFPVRLEREGPSFPPPTRPGSGVEFDELAGADHSHSLTDMPHCHKQDGSHTNW